MPKSAQQTRLIIGSNHISNKTTAWSVVDQMDTYDQTTIADGAYGSMAGQTHGNMTATMIFDTDTTTGGQWSTLTNWKAAAPQPMTFAPSGLTRANECIMAYALESQLNATSPVANRAGCSIAAQFTETIAAGVLLEDFTAITTDTNGTSTDNGASSASGGFAHLHVSAFSGLTNDVIVVEHSTNNSVWATLLTFATVTGLTYERVYVTGTVNRYLRVRDDVTGTGSITRACSFARY